MTTQRYIYFIRPIGQDGPIKIGHSVSPPSRLQTMMAWSPMPLELIFTIPGDVGLERRIHAKFNKSHSHKEWFFGSTELVKFVCDLLAGATIGSLIDLDAPLPRAYIRPKKKLSAGVRQRMSYRQRISLALKRLDDGAVYYTTPDEVYGIMQKWAGHRSAPVPPTDDEIEYLERFIADPSAYGELKRRAA